MADDDDIVALDNEVSLNGTRFPLRAPVQYYMASQYAPAQRLAGQADAEDPRVAVKAWENFTAGIGMQNDDRDNPDRAWYGTLDIRNKALTLPQAATTVPYPTLTTHAGGHGPGVTTPCGAIGHHVGTSKMFFGYTSRLFQLTSAGTWTTGGAVTSLDIAGGTEYTDFESYTSPDSGDEVAVFGGNVGQVKGSSVSTGVGWAKLTNNWQGGYGGQRLVAWDEKLFGIRRALGVTGQFRYWTSALDNVGTAAGRISGGQEEVETLLVGRDSWGENIIYAATHTGLFAYDFANHRFLKTDLDLPRQPVAGQAVYWRGSIYYSAGGSIYRYTANPPSIELVGPDRDGGLPKDRRGDITNMVVSHNEILASIDPGTAGKATILGYDGDGWRVAWEAGTSGVPVDAMFVSDVNDATTNSTVSGLGFDVGYRLWWAAGADVYFLPLPTEVVNPQAAYGGSLLSRKTSGSLELPVFNAGDVGALKTFLSFELLTKVPAKTRIDPEFRVNRFAETSPETSANVTTNPRSTVQAWRKLFVEGTNVPAVLTSNTHTGTAATTDDATLTTHIATSDSSGEGVGAGVDFHQIQFRIKMSKFNSIGATYGHPTNTPQVLSARMRYRKKLSPKRGFVFDIEIPDEGYGGKGSKALGEALDTALDTTGRIKMSYRPPGGITDTFWVDLSALPESLDHSGHDYSGRVLVRAEEI